MRLLGQLTADERGALTDRLGDALWELDEDIAQLRRSAKPMRDAMYGTDVLERATATRQEIHDLLDHDF
jgi:hypothetical protein